VSESETSSATTIPWVHAGRLRAAEREIGELVTQALSIAREGRAAAPAAPVAYVPVPPAQAEELETTLRGADALRERLRTLAGPDPATTARGRQSGRAAVSARLAQLEDVLRDLQPERLQARYGELPPEALAEIRAICDGLAELLQAARKVLHGH
jgi:hypothetical protein